MHHHPSYLEGFSGLAGLGRLAPVGLLVLGHDVHGGGAQGPDGLVGLEVHRLARLLVHHLQGVARGGHLGLGGQVHQQVQHGDAERAAERKRVRTVIEGCPEKRGRRGIAARDKYRTDEDGELTCEGAVFCPSGPASIHPHPCRSTPPQCLSLQWL